MSEKLMTDLSDFRAMDAQYRRDLRTQLHKHIIAWRESGRTDKELCEALNIGAATLNRWYWGKGVFSISFDNADKLDRLFIKVGLKKSIPETMNEEEIPTVRAEYIKRLIRKDIPMPLYLQGDGYSDGELVIDTAICENCNAHYEIDFEHYKYCPNCGQRLDWSEVDKNE